jgi:hypothetical protein
VDRPSAAIVHRSSTEWADTRLRRRIQAASDRRFSRAQDHAAKTLAALGATLRTDTNLSELSNHRVTAVRVTVQPASVSLWLRPAQRAGAVTPREQAPQSPLGGS